jgi:hypothetical protein
MVLNVDSILDVHPEWVVKASPLLAQTSTDLRPSSGPRRAVER